LRYLPCFHVVATASRNQQTMEFDIVFNLLTFHGRQLKCHVVSAIGIEDAFIDMLDDLSRGHIKLCRGVSKRPSFPVKNDDVLLECLADDVIARSRNCQFYVIDDVTSTSSDDDVSGIQCVECKCLAASDIPVLKTENGGAGSSNNDFKAAFILDKGDGNKQFTFSNKDQLLASIKTTKPEIIEQEMKPEAVVIGDVAEASFLPSFAGRQQNINCKPPALGFNGSVTIHKTRGKSVKQRIESPRKKREMPAVTILMDDYGDDDHNFAYSNESDDNSEDSDFKPSTKAMPKSKKMAAAKIKKESVSITKVKTTATRKYNKTSTHWKPRKTQNASTVVQCRVCLISYPSQGQMEKCMGRHREMIELDRPAECPVCNEIIPSRLDVTNHFFTKHAGDDTTCCCECMELVKVSKLSRHIVVNHHHMDTAMRPKEGIVNKQVVKKAKKDGPKEPLIKTIHTCKVCLLKFKCHSSLQNCMKRHQEEMDLNANVECPLCNLQLQKLDVTAHFKKEHKETGQTCCCECLSLVTNEKGMLRRHITQHHHKAGKSHLCAECGKAYHTKTCLERHMNEVHLGVITHFCEQCGDSFAHKTQYQRHLKRHDEANLKCIHCDKVFIRRFQLIKHLKMHTKFKPYKCLDCNYTSERKGNVSLHVVKVHHRKWTNNDIVVDQEQLEAMKKMAIEDANHIFAVNRGKPPPVHHDDSVMIEAD